MRRARALPARSEPDRARNEQAHAEAAGGCDDLAKHAVKVVLLHGALLGARPVVRPQPSDSVQGQASHANGFFSTSSAQVLLKDLEVEV